MTQEFRPGLVEPSEDEEEGDDLWILAIQDEARRRTEYDNLSTVGFGGKKKSMVDDRAQLAQSLRGTSSNEREPPGSATGVVNDPALPPPQTNDDTTT